MAKKIKVQVKQAIADSDFISITTDAWTSNVTTSYLALAAHFITPFWKLESACLGVAELESHSALGHKEMLTKLLEE